MAHEEEKKLFNQDARCHFAPWTLWEVKGPADTEFHPCISAPLWFIDCSYRRKQPRSTMKKINNQREFMQALLDGETVSNNNDYFGACWKMKYNSVEITGGLYESPKKYPVYIKPKTININGFEVTEPVRSIKYYDQPLWAFDLCMTYGEDEYFEIEKRMALGIIHSSEENAEIHRNALLSFTRTDK